MRLPITRPLFLPDILPGRDLPGDATPNGKGFFPHFRRVSLSVGEIPKEERGGKKREKKQHSPFPYHHSSCGKKCVAGSSCVCLQWRRRGRALSSVNSAIGGARRRTRNRSTKIRSEMVYTIYASSLARSCLQMVCETETGWGW